MLEEGYKTKAAFSIHLSLPAPLALRCLVGEGMRSKPWAMAAAWGVEHPKAAQATKSSVFLLCLFYWAPQHKGGTWASLDHTSSRGPIPPQPLWKKKKAFTAASSQGSSHRMPSEGDEPSFGMARSFRLWLDFVMS